MQRFIVIAAVALMLLPFAEAVAGKRGGGGGPSCNLNGHLEGLPLESLSKKEKTGLLFMREEEKLARDVYLSLHEAWSLRAFSNIAAAESRHMRAALTLIEKYDLDDPVGDNGVGVFSNPEFTELYEDLTASGSASLVAALEVGALIEELDIHDLKRVLENVDNEDLAVAYQNLMKGSRNHVRAFDKLLSRNGAEYETEYLTQEEYDAIAESPREKGMVDAEGNLLCGGGRGKSN